MNAVTSVFESVGGKGSVDDILDNVIDSLDSLDTVKDDYWTGEMKFNWLIDG